jgi:membrane associated rhomboid family serine protease
VAEGRSSHRPARTVSGAPHGQQPKITIALIAINVAVFVITAIQAGGTDSLGRSGWFGDGILVPSLVASGDWWRLLTSGFLHLSITHIGLNMLALYFVGLPLERVVGRWRFLAIYLLSLLGGSVTVMLFADSTGGAVGASGAIFGLMGALVAVFLRFRYDLRQLMIVVVINLAITFVIPGISWQAHVGGLIVGGIAGAAMVYPPPKTRLAWQIGVCVGLLAVLAVLLVIRIGQITG